MSDSEAGTGLLASMSCQTGRARSSMLQTWRRLAEPRGPRPVAAAYRDENTSAASSSSALSAASISTLLLEAERADAEDAREVPV